MDAKVVMHCGLVPPDHPSLDWGLVEQWWEADHWKATMHDDTVVFHVHRWEGTPYERSSQHDLTKNPRNCSKIRERQLAPDYRQ